MASYFAWATKACALGLAALALGSGAKREIPLWHKAGRDGFSCTSCHTPNGREIWDSTISLEDVRRRAMMHLGPMDSAELARQIGALRQTLVSPSNVRPFEPAGLAGTGTVAQRDEAFGRELSRICPRLTHGTVKDLRDAEIGAHELTLLPLSKVKPTFVIDPISRDPYRRKQDGPLLGDWIPDIGLSPGGTKAFEEICRQNGDLDLRAVDEKLAQIEGKPKTAIAQLAWFKRLALLEYVAFLQNGQRPALQPPSAALTSDPIWAVGDFARLETGKTPEQMGIDSVTASRLGVAMGQAMDLKQMALSWLWVGWTLDPSLKHISLDRKAQSGQYLADMFWHAGPYPWHAAYFAARRPLEARTLGECFQPEINAFVNEDALQRFAPRDKSFCKFVENILRMDCLLLERDLDQGKKPLNAYAARQQLGALAAFMHTHASGVIWQHVDRKLRPFTPMRP